MPRTPPYQADHPSTSAAVVHIESRTTRVVVQQRQRLFREGISQLLEAEADIEVAAMVATDTEMLAACQEHRPAACVVEADATDWDPVRLVAAMRRAVPNLAVVGLTALAPTAAALSRTHRSGMPAVVSRDTGISGILAALRMSTTPSVRSRRAPRTPPPGPPPTALTARELEILSLVAAGLTSAGVAGRLQISHKTVENHKQRIFAKLGVQNQAHAVSIAMRSGLMRPDRIIGLAVGD